MVQTSTQVKKKPVYVVCSGILKPIKNLLHYTQIMYFHRLCELTILQFGIIFGNKIAQNMILA